MTSSPPLLRWLVAGASLVLALSCAYGVSLAFSGGRTQWFVVGFEVLVVGAAVFGILLAKGKFTSGPAITLAMIAMTAVIATGLELVAKQLAVRQLVLHPFFLGRIALAGVFCGVATVLVLNRDKRSWRTCFLGIATTAAGVAAGVGAIVASSRSNIASPGLAALGIVGLLIVGTLVLACLSIGLHLIIRAFEFGHFDEPKTTSTAA